jgi:hypothetical protein
MLVDVQAADIFRYTKLDADAPPVYLSGDLA